MTRPFTDSSKTVNLVGVALRSYADVDYPDPYNPHGHQYRLQQALEANTTGVFLNTAPTGGGKTLSWAVPAVTQNINTIAVYPTNALATDQKANIEREIDKLGETAQVEAVTSERLRTVYQDRYGVTTNGEALSLLLKDAFKSNDKPVILLTNPDTFVLLRRRMYRARTGRYKSFEMAVVDEFHRASRKEKNTLLFLLDEMHDLDDEKYCRLNKIVLLSATPDEQVKQRLNAMSPEWYHLNDGPESLPIDCGDLEEGEPRRAFTEDSDLTGYRAAMPPVKLQVERIEPFSTADKLIHNQEKYIDYLTGERTVIMVDGVHEVAKLHEQTERLLPDQNVERIDGFKSANLKRKLEIFDVLVSNSAVEVGVDFDANQIIFSGTSAASTLQRLGRLRTNETTQQGIAFVPSTFAAVLSPEDLRDRAEPHATTEDGAWFTRTAFREHIQKYDYTSSSPDSFDWRVSAPSAYYHIINRVNDSTSEDAETVLKNGARRVNDHFLSSTETETTDNIFQPILENVRDAATKSGKTVLDEIQTYRTTGIQSLVYDVESESVKLYNLLHLLRRCDVEFVSKDELKAEAGPRYHDEIDSKADYSIGYCLFYGPYEQNTHADTDGYTSREVSFTATGADEIIRLCQQSASDRTPQLCTGLNVTVDSHIPGIEKLNNALRQTKIMCYPLQMRPENAEERFQLGQFQFTHRLTWQGNTWTLTFGETALTLYCKYQDDLVDQQFKLI